MLFRLRYRIRYVFGEPAVYQGYAYEPICRIPGSFRVELW